MWRGVWRDLTLDFQSEPGVREYALGQAQEILTVVIEGYTTIGDDRLVLPALSALRGLGEGYALMSERWPIEGLPAPALPVRSNVPP